MGELLSPVEAILQNILGADNILVPPGSQVEEILQAIYYNTEYEKNPKSRVAEILLAIKNKGVYDGPVLSRVEDILVHKLNNIPYTKHKKEDLSRVEQLLLDWLEQGGGEEIIEYTGTFPMTILANGEPLLDYIISGNTVQSGTPTPGNPVMPQGTGERTGNLFDKTTLENGIYLAANGNKYGNVTNGVRSNVKIKALPNTAYTLSAQSTAIVSLRILEWSNGTFIKQTPKYNISGDISLTVTTDAETTEIAFNIEGENGQYATNIMLNLGSTALPYEPYGYKLDISSANTTTPIYLGEVQTTRKIKKLVFDGTESWQLNNRIASVGGKYFNLSIATQERTEFGKALCSHYTIGNPYDRLTACCVTVNYSRGIDIRVNNPSTDGNITDFKSYLAAQYAAGTPVTVWYVLAEPETGIVNEPLMKIGDYADTLSMEQAGVDVPTNIKPTETVIDVPTSVKPSEGYIKYTEPTDGPALKTQVLGTKNHEIYVTSNNEVYILRR